MKPKYPSNKYTIVYDVPSKKFFMYKDNVFVDKHDNGRELARDAWIAGADEVCYDYDLGLDEYIPLIPLHEKYKT